MFAVSTEPGFEVPAQPPEWARGADQPPADSAPARRKPGRPKGSTNRPSAKVSTAKKGDTKKKVKKAATGKTDAPVSGGVPKRGPGRPRRDGLTPGSPEAQEADKGAKRSKRAKTDVSAAEPTSENQLELVPSDVPDGLAREEQSEEQAA
jgi:hypothetical protein